MPETPAPTPPPEDPQTLRAAEAVGAALPDALEGVEAAGRHPCLRVRAEHLVEVARLLRDHPALRLDCCHLISGVDRPDEGVIEVVYHLVSFAVRPDAAYRARAGKNDAWVALKVRVPRERPEVPSVMDVWTGADWHERETWDLVGVVFTGRAGLRRIMLPEDWPGHPLRKDWVYPVAYHGVPIVPPEAQ
jgi:NADH-quinone oxidoreductase subunit C